jgi:hypothetical protein
MTSPRLLKGGILLLDPDTATARPIISLQYNPDTLSPTLQPQAIKESGDRLEAFRLTVPPVETIKVDAESIEQRMACDRLQREG